LYEIFSLSIVAPLRALPKTALLSLAALPSFTLAQRGPGEPIGKVTAQVAGDCDDLLSNKYPSGRTHPALYTRHESAH
jgi:hypothetical protein